MTEETLLQWMRMSIWVSGFASAGFALLGVVLGVAYHYVSERVNAPKPYVHPIRAGWSADETADIDDFTVENDGSDIIEIPDPGVDGKYLVLWRSDVDGGDFDFIDPRNQSINQRGAFTAATPLSIGGVAGQSVRSAYPLKRAEGARTVHVDEPPGWQ